MKLLSVSETTDGLLVTRQRGDATKFSYVTATPSRYGFEANVDLNARFERIIEYYEKLVQNMDGGKLRNRYFEVIELAREALDDQLLDL